jgi:hypothetical protein
MNPQSYTLPGASAALGDNANLPKTSQAQAESRVTCCSGLAPWKYGQTSRGDSLSFYRPDLGFQIKNLCLVGRPKECGQLSLPLGCHVIPLCLSGGAELLPRQ